jgi:hypothetical protein
MRWGDETRSLHKAFRPAPDTIIGPDRRLRHPAVQEEIELRVDIYAEQVERYGRIGRWLPRRGSGRSVRMGQDKNITLAEESQVLRQAQRA